MEGQDLYTINLHDLYGENNPVLDHFFPNQGFINFGYWSPLPNSPYPISLEMRMKSQADLYRVVFKMLNVKSSDKILEVGCGRGGGCRLLYDLYHPQKIIGLDLTPQQIQRAVEANLPLLRQVPNLQFSYGKAEELPFPASTFSKVYSVEAAQHFTSIFCFIEETARVLEANGEFLLSTFFATSPSGLEELKKRIPCHAAGVDHTTVIDSVLDHFEGLEFEDISCSSIGDKVFKGFKIWTDQCTIKDWAGEWPLAWEDGLLDYYIITARKKRG